MILPPILGTSLVSELNVTVALTIYAVAIMSRSVSDALLSVDPAIRQSATAVGYGSWRRFWAVEFPLAGPVILAGLRVAAVSTISLVTVGVLIGVESLGYLFTNGFQRRIVPEILAGVDHGRDRRARDRPAPRVARSAAHALGAAAEPRPKSSAISRWPDRRRRS